MLSQKGFTIAGFVYAAMNGKRLFPLISTYTNILLKGFKTMTHTTTKNEQFNSIEITFSGKPSDRVREALKGLRFRWHNVKKCWYGYTDEETAEKAIAEAEATEKAEAEPLTIPKAEFVDGGGLYDGWKGGNNSKWSTDDELKKLILADYKKVGIKATVRKERAGYLTALTVTVQIKKDEIISFEEWSQKENNRFLMWGLSSWVDYIDKDGNRKTIQLYEVETMPNREEIENAIRELRYNNIVKNIETSSYYRTAPDILTDEAAARFNLAVTILTSYNKDCSNSMIDYFDRDIYDSYYIKVNE